MFTTSRHKNKYISRVVPNPPLSECEYVWPNILTLCTILYGILFFLHWAFLSMIIWPCYISMLCPMSAKAHTNDIFSNFTLSFSLQTTIQSRFSSHSFISHFYLLSSHGPCSNSAQSCSPTTCPSIEHYLSGKDTWMDFITLFLERDDFQLFFSYRNE